MSALISRQGYALDQFPMQDSTADYWEYNDPWDYFGFVMANSLPQSNADGYGVLSYRENNPLLLTRDMWFKRVTNASEFGEKYYTGRFLELGNTNAFWDYDVMDTALYRIKNGNNRPAIVMCHARNATGLTFGSHPFVFNWRNRSYAFMHNGNSNPARSFMINRINQMNPQTNWFQQHPSEYFNNPNPIEWVDSEVMFHYLLNYIILHELDVLGGLNHALSDMRQYFVGSYPGVYNFIMSDGSSLYAFRSTTQTSSYKLSYKSFGEQFYGIRTQAPFAGDTELNALELVVFPRNHKPLHYPEITRILPFRQALEPEVMLFNPPTLVPGVQINPNPVSGAVTDITLKLFIPNLTGTAEATVDIYNLKGQCVLSYDLQLINGSLNLKRSLPVLPNGIYICRLSSGNRQAQTRFSIIK